MSVGICQNILMLLTSSEQVGAGGVVNGDDGANWRKEWSSQHPIVEPPIGRHSWANQLMVLGEILRMKEIL